MLILILNVPFSPPPVLYVFYFLCIFKALAGVDKSLASVNEASRFGVNILSCFMLDNISRMRNMKGNSDQDESNIVEFSTKISCITLALAQQTDVSPA